MVPNQEKTRLINQFKTTVTHSSHCNFSSHLSGTMCRIIVLVKQDSLCQFSRLFWNASSTAFQSPELLIQCGFICGFIWMETIQLLSGKVEFNTCQVSLLWHNSSLVSVWTFHPTLVYKLIPVTFQIVSILTFPVYTSYSIPNHMLLESANVSV